MKKKKWNMPKLIALVKGDRQEQILSVCKKDSWASTGPSDIANGCGNDAADCVDCAIRRPS